MTTLMDEAVDVGTTKRLTFAVRTLDRLATPLDPVSVTLETKNPHGHVQNQTVVRDSAGEYYADVFTTYSGQWRYKFTATDPQRSYQGSFVVRRSVFDQALVVPVALSWAEANALTWNQANNLTWRDVA